jgi:hypothetical protein
VIPALLVMMVLTFPPPHQDALDAEAGGTGWAPFQLTLEAETGGKGWDRFQLALEAETGRFAQAWASGDAQALGRVLNPAGIRLHLPGEEHMLIQPRQAQAALRAFLSRYPGGDARVTRVSAAGGDSRKGFAEIRWRTRSQGINEAVMFTLFVAFSLDGEVWRVTELRVLP